MAEERKFSPPQPTVGDHAHILGRAISSLIPGGAELFKSIIFSPIEKRRDEWMEEVGQTLRRWESEGVNLEALKDNPLFLDTVLHATTIAMRNHQKEKHEALKKVILGAVNPDSEYETFMQMALNYIDTLTLCHVSILKLLASPRHWEEQNQPKRFPTQVYPLNMYTLIQTAFPSIEKDLYESIVRDLYSKGLLETEPPNPNAPMASEIYEIMMKGHASIMGGRFLALFG